MSWVNNLRQLSVISSVDLVRAAVDASGWHPTSIKDMAAEEEHVSKTYSIKQFNLSRFVVK